ncbi:hypothetical protein YYE_04481 [Plasmodium vinckei vinckei]|uniref:Uncharacterized protein n=1 Tax=Plasmodium vinckei vinckei TaxID=54757 RepID=A0A081IAE2_PLAVN|nr:hypothetical protein YYE_04481 [Plasmodium vinckei vinckei]
MYLKKYIHILSCDLFLRDIYKRMLVKNEGSLNGVNVNNSSNNNSDDVCKSNWREIIILLRKTI